MLIKMKSRIYAAPAVKGLRVTGLWCSVMAGIYIKLTMKICNVKDFSVRRNYMSFSEGQSH